MCFLGEKTENWIRSEVQKFLDNGNPFTGLEICQSMMVGKNPAALEEYPFVSSKDVSTYTRQLFNQGGMPGWASTQVIPHDGPVLYFKVHPNSVAGKRAKEIQNSLGNGKFL